jgi:hypothetical protein
MKKIKATKYLARTDRCDQLNGRRIHTSPNAGQVTNGNTKPFVHQRR